MLKRLLFATTLGLMLGTANGQVTVYEEDFEGATSATYTGSLTPQAITGLSNWEYVCSNTFGEMRTDQVAQSGTKAMAMYEGSGSTEPQNEVIGTFDMSAYSVSDSIDLKFSFLHNNDESDVHDRAWVRGNNTAAWVEVLDLSSIMNFSNDNIWLTYTIDFDSALNAAGQDFSATTQVRFGQQDNSSWSGGDGIAYDDVSIIAYQYGVNINGNNIACFNDPAGYAIAEATLGVSPYTYLWSTGATTDSIGGLGAGTYCVTATDANGDTTSNCFVVEGTDSIFSDITVVTDLVCDYDISEVQVQGSGGEPFSQPYVMDTNSANYSWDSSGTCTTINVTGGNVSPMMDIGFDFEFYGNTYDQLQVAGNGFIGFGGGLDNGCCSGEPLPDPSTFEPNNAIFAGWFDVDNFTEYSMCLAGEAPFRRLIVNFVGLGDCTTDDNMTAQIILHESTNCIEIQTDYMTYDGCYTSTDDNTQGMQNLGGTLAQTFPGRNGEGWEADDSYLSFCPVGTGDLYYAWDNGSVGSTIVGLGEGTHVVSVTDAFGCFIEDSVSLEATSSLESNLTVSDVSCFGFDDASINPGISGEFGNLTYTWSNGATTSSLNNIGPGTYSVSVEDAVNCTIEVNDIVVEEPALIQTNIYNVNAPVCPEDGTGAANINVTGGVEPYMITWNPGGLTGTMVSGLNEGSYQIVVEDSNGCESYTALNLIAENDAPSVDLGPNIYEASTSTVILDAGNQFSYQWNTGALTQTIPVNMPGTYWVEVTNAAGCVASDTIYVEVWPAGIDEAGNDVSLVVYPNPAREQLSIALNADSDLRDVEVKVINLTGSTVLQRNVQSLASGQALDLDVSSLPAGSYQLSIQSETVQTVQSFVKH